MSEDTNQMSAQRSLAAQLDANTSYSSSDDWKSNTGPSSAVVEVVTSTPEPLEEAAVSDEEYAPRLIVFREVPGFDPRTLVLSYGEESTDLQFCSCVNKYKKRFGQFLTSTPEFLSDVKSTVLTLKSEGYESVSIGDVLDYLRLKAKLTTQASEYLSLFPHDFELDKIERDYLERKLMMEEPELFNYFDLTPVKCRSNCGYGTSDVPEEEEAPTSLAGF